jgi:hypothetical protein
MGQSASNAADAAAKAAKMVVKCVTTAAVAEVVAEQSPVYTYAWKFSNLKREFLYQATNINWWAHDIIPPDCICSYKTPSM